MPPAQVVSATEARRVLLRLQALAEPPGRAGPAATVRLVERLGYLQIDSINSVERAHHLILGSRLSGFRPSHLAHGLERSRRLFEHWTHDACAIPARWYPYWHHRFRRYSERDRAHAWWQGRFGPDPERVLRTVLARLRRDGPLRARDFEPADGLPRGPGGWWEWRPEKAALEHLWRSGRLAVVRRVRFEKVYDLSERVHPELHGAPVPSEEAHRDWACRSAIERLGIATESEISRFLNAVPRPQVRTWAARELHDGRLVRVSVAPEGGGRPVACLALPEWASFAAPVEPAPMRTLCPFDPVLRDRARTLRLFAFDYRFEAFTPAAKRRYGYYVMPLLAGDRLVGRVDPRFNRPEATLEARGPWWEPGVRPTVALRAAAREALEALAAQIGATRVRWEAA
ncbi:MAG: crosslink repair DNA glycosylase YcaQ family protein [Phycisphaerales bacterium]